MAFLTSRSQAPTYGIWLAIWQWTRTNGPYFCISFEKILKYFMLDLAKQACLVLMIEMKIAWSWKLIIENYTIKVETSKLQICRNVKFPCFFCKQIWRIFHSFPL
jgi:hypothetical protein